MKFIETSTVWRFQLPSGAILSLTDMESGEFVENLEKANREMRRQYLEMSNEKDRWYRTACGLEAETRSLDHKMDAYYDLIQKLHALAYFPDEHSEEEFAAAAGLYHTITFARENPVQDES